MSFSVARLDQPELLTEVNEFYAVFGKFALASADDLVFLARDNEGALSAVVRLAEEQGSLVLRSMLVREDLRRTGLGKQLLGFFEDYVTTHNLGPIYGLPHGELENFYANAKFRRIEDDSLPSFLNARLKSYRHEHPELSLFGIRRDVEI